VKTLHQVAWRILHVRGNRSMWRRLESAPIEPIDMVVVNLYRFEKTAGKPGATFSDIIREHRYWGTVDGALGGEEL